MREQSAASRIVNLRILLAVLALLILSGCGTRRCHDDFITVTPVKYVAPTGLSNSRFGWLEVPLEEAMTFGVKIGSKPYCNLYDKVGRERIIEELARFAETEVAKRGYCKGGRAKTIKPQLVGPRSREYMSLLVECVEQ